MLKRFKNFLSVALAVLMLITVIPFSVSAATITASGQCGENLIWVLDSEGTLTISGTGAMYDYKNPNDFTVEEGAAPWNAYKGKIEFLKLEEGITYIGDYAFFNCNICNYLEIPEGVTEIGIAAFWGSDIYVVSFPATLEYIGEMAFFRCSEIIKICYNGSNEEWENVRFGIENEPINLNTESKMVYNFSSDSVLASGTAGENITWTLTGDGTLVISGSGEMTSSPWVKYGCVVKKVIVEDGITSIRNNAFYSMYYPAFSSLTSVALPESINTIGNNAFEECSNLTTINMSSNITSIGDSSFAYCKKLSDITIPEKITSIGRMAFVGCSSVTEITLPEGLQSIGRGAFNGCDITTVTIPKTVTSIDSTYSYLRDAGAVFCGDNFKEIIVDEQNEMYCSENGILYNKDKTNLILYPKAKKGTTFIVPASVTTIEANAFSGTEIETITLHNNITEIKSCAFSSSAVKNIALPESITSISVALFINCKNLENITIPNTVKVINEDSFYGCTAPSDVYFIGTEEEWKEIKIYSIPENATIHFCEHKNTEVIPGRDSTCTKTGLTDGAYCIACKKVVTEQTTIPVKDHDYTAVITTPATHLTQGVKTFTCTCGDTYTESIAKLEGHTYTSKITTYPSHIAEGVRTYTCKCGDTYTEPIAKLEGHTYSSKITTYPTHVTEGVRTYTCKCGDTYTEAIEKTAGHSYSAVVTAPTCTKGGYTTYTCVCGDSYVADYTDTTEHSYTAEITTPATHLTEGVMTYACICGDSYTESVAKLKDHTYTSEVTKEATHLEEGEAVYTCKCGDSYTEAIGKLPGHTYETVVTAPTCTTEGYTTYTCECGYSYVADYVDAKGHSYTSFVEAEPDCKTQGSMVFECECGYYYIEAIPATGHKDNDNNNACDNCGVGVCDHMCHKTGFLGFIWKIINFFQKLFGTNPVCECGMAHY